MTQIRFEEYFSATLGGTSSKHDYQRSVVPHPEEWFYVFAASATNQSFRYATSGLSTLPCGAVINSG